MADYLTSFFGLFASTENQLILMFLSAFLSSTVLPGNSEMIFSTLISQITLSGEGNTALTLFLIATLGNSLGSFTTYLMALLVPPPKLKTEMNRHTQWALRHSQQYGVWILLLSWLPVVGDVLCGVAGWLRLNPWQSLLVISLGKAARYAIIWWGIASFIG